MGNAISGWIQNGVGKVQVMMKNCIIVSGGKTEDGFVKQWLDKEQPLLVIAADSGMEVLMRIGWKTDFIIGDFDSVNQEAFEHFHAQEGIIWKKLNPVKDDTDTEFAIRLAISEGADQITRLGATGSRLDHVLGNLELLGIGLESGVEITLVDPNNRVRLIQSGIRLKKSCQYGDYVSLIPYSKEVTHLYLEGFKYPLADYLLKGFCSLGVSYEIVDEEAEIRFEDGILFVIESKD